MTGAPAEFAASSVRACRRFLVHGAIDQFGPLLIPLRLERGDACPSERQPFCLIHLQSQENRADTSVPAPATARETVGYFFDAAEVVFGTAASAAAASTKPAPESESGPAAIGEKTELPGPGTTDTSRLVMSFAVDTRIE